MMTTTTYRAGMAADTEISGEEKEIKKSKKKGILTAGLATVATVHAAHNVYQSMEKREARRKALKEGDITKTQAQREKNKARLQDAAAIGIAALGIKGAYSEWQEMREHHHESKEYQEKIERHRHKRESRRRKAEEMQKYKDSNYTGSMPNLHPRYGDSGSVSPYSHGPPTHYYDDNPYSAYSAPTHQHLSQPFPPQHQQFPPHPQQFPPPPIGPARAETH